MDPVTMAALSSAAPYLTAGATAIGAVGQYQAANAQAKADKQRAAVQAQWAERRALEEKASGQRAAGEETRKARLAQSRLTAVAGASGSGVDDASVMDLWADIDQEGAQNAAMATAAAQQRASGIQYQSAMDQWTTEQNNRIRKSAASTSLIGGLVGAGGQFGSGMAQRYGGPKSSSYKGYYG